MNKKEKIVLVGGGGHCKSVIDVIECEGRFEIAGIVDQREMKGQFVLGYEIIADDSELSRLVLDYRNFIITVGQLKSNATRVRLFNEIKNFGGVFPKIFSPHSYTSKYAQIEEGTVIMHHALINANARIGKNSIVNTGAVIEHDSFVGDHCHIATGAYINGECQIESNVFIGSNSVLLQKSQIGSGSVIGAGSVVTGYVTANSLFAGVPATFKKRVGL